jgi:hypothetical protein
MTQHTSGCGIVDIAKGANEFHYDVIIGPVCRRAERVGETPSVLDRQSSMSAIGFPICPVRSIPTACADDHI